MLKKLGRGNITQKSIVNADFTEHLDKFNEILLNYKYKIIKNFLPNSNKLENKFWYNYFKTGAFDFDLNFHVIKFVIYNKNNLERIFKYINFRFLFNQVSKKKIITDFPPYLLIEPVSTCNLRCPFCFQTDKTFTRKPFMGTMDLDFFKNIIDQADDLGIGAITLASRGEPTLHKNLKDMLKYMHDKKNIFEKKLNTNATFLNEELCYEIFNSEINQVVISADHYERACMKS